jgi:hypothetical protein
MACCWLANRLPLPPFAKLAKLCVMDDRNQIDFDAPASLRKWPSSKNERVTTSLYIGPYLVVDGTFDECIREFMHHLYEIHTAPQGGLVSAVLSARHILEIARLRDFL